MSSSHLAEQLTGAGAPPPEQAPRAVDLSDRPCQFEAIPQVCLVEDVCRILRLSERQFFYLMKRRALALVELPRLDRHRRFTGESLARVIRMRRA